MGNRINVDVRESYPYLPDKITEKKCNISNMLKNYTILFGILLLHFYTVQAQSQKYTFETGKMGSPFRIIVSTQDSTGLSHIIKKAFERAEDLENQLSDYRANSDVSQVNRLAGKGVFFSIQPEFKEILLESIRAKKITHGALNVFAGQMVKEWRRTRSTKILPDSLLLQTISKAISGECVVFSKDSTAIYLTNAMCQLDFGSIGKGFVAQKVLDFLVQKGLTYVLVDAGGKIVCTQVNEKGDDWKVGLELPQSKELATDYLKVKNTSLATSGKTYQFVEVNGKEYSHVLNPTTGWALTHARSATVITQNGALSDWLATAATILEIENLKEIISYFKDVKILVWQNKSGKLEIIFNYEFYKQ